jgi:outer membrane protein
MKLHTIGIAAAVAMAATVAFSPSARADDGNFEVRLRAVYLDPANDSAAIPSLDVPQDAIHINSKWLPDVDFEYYFTPNWSSELVLTYPQTQTVTVEHSALGGPTNIGTFKHLPPVLTVKYDFLPNEAFQPYFGVGVNFTIISDVNLAVPGVSALKLSSTSVGPALQTGFDYKLADHWYLNADVKWFKLGSDVDLPGGTRVSSVTINPWLFGFGIGYRFGGHPSAAPPPMAAPAPAPVAAPPPPVVQAAPPPPPPVVKPAAPKVSEEVVLRGVNFSTASAKLTPESSKVLDEVAASLAKRAVSTAEIHGYTDSVGKPEYNLKLSQRRAEAVVAYLVAHGTPASQLSAKGFGEENPIEDNKTAEGRAANRRVTIKFSEPVAR